MARFTAIDFVTVRQDRDSACPMPVIIRRTPLRKSVRI